MDFKKGHLYILESEKDATLYFGSTNDVGRRLHQHNAGFSVSTRNKRPWKLLAVITLDHASDARRLEQKLKAQKQKITLPWLLQASAEYCEKHSLKYIATSPVHRGALAN